MERALKKRLYVYTIGMFLATVLVVSVITIYYDMEDKATQLQQIIRIYCRRQVIQEMVRGICSYMVGNIFHLL